MLSETRHTRRDKCYRFSFICGLSLLMFVCVCMCVYHETENGAKKGEKGIKEEVGHDRTLVA